MDLEDGSSSDDLDTNHLTDNKLLFLSEHYLKQQDCLALALSGASDSFPSLYTANRTRLAIGRFSFFLTPNSWTRFFKELISPLSITVLNASHSYWLPAAVLLHSIVQMTNLEELGVKDTQINLTHFPLLFKSCDKIVKLSLTLNERFLNEKLLEKSSLDLLKKGFSQLTHLEISNFAFNDDRFYHQFWRVIFGVLKWCRDCINLVMKMASPDGKPLEFDTADVEEIQIFDLIELEFFPLLTWMKNLKSLTILRSDNPLMHKDLFISRLIEWLVSKSPDSLECLWLTEGYLNEQFREDDLSGQVVKSVVLSQDSRKNYKLEDERYLHLEHLAGVVFRELDHQPQLKYIRGECLENYRGLNDFCRSHWRLEQLHFDICGLPRNELEEDCVFGEGDWSLPLLKILVFRCFRPSKRVLEQVMKACPNIEQLHIGRMSKTFFNYFPVSPIPIDHFHWIHLHNGFYLSPIFQQCPKLESLHLSGMLEDSEIFFNQLTLCLSSAANLRDLRMCWKLYHNDGVAHLLLFLTALMLKSSNLKYFERLVLHVSKSVEFEKSAEFEEFIVPFAKGMTHLVALGFFGFPIDSSAAEGIRRRLTNEVVPNRPAFWFHLDNNRIPEEIDASIPRIHYDEVVNPIDPFFAPPKF